MATHKKTYEIRICERCYKKFQCRTDAKNRFCGWVCSARRVGHHLLGRRLSDEHKKKIGEGAKRSESWRVLFKPDVRAKAIEAAKLNQPTKERHWNWKGGVPRLVPERGTPAWKQWRKQVFERDDYICQHCGVRGGLLVPHHIVPRRIRPDLIYDINNGSTLCSTCHPTVEKEFRLMNLKMKEGETLRHLQE